jgi:isoamylase
MTAGSSKRVLSTYVQEVSEPGNVRVGSPLPLGTRQRGDGVNFAIFSRNATRVWLELFDRPKDGVPARVVELDPARHRTGDVWHVWIKGLRVGQFYAYRIAGPYCPQAGQRFNKNRLLLDPYATAISDLADWDFSRAQGYDPALPQGDLSFADQDDADAMPKCIFTHEDFDWRGDRPLRHPWSQTIIYETHVRGFTVHPSSTVAHPGTYRGLVEKLAYLKDLGVTAIELMPVQEFNRNGPIQTNPQTGTRLRDYWGYDPVAFFAPKAAYCSAGGLGQQKLEFMEMVRACHQAGIEVFLDIVFNHTAEGNELGPTIGLRGVDNAIFYMLQEDKRFYKNYTGVGNTIKANHPVVRDFILDALRYWVVEMRVDGFRFDLASVLDRDPQGNLLPDAPLLERIAEDPILRDVRLIAEAWDAAGAYQVGNFSGRRWAEWNGRYRDDVRRFWRGDAGLLGSFASRICGSADLYQRSGKGPESSINFITCHDGFTLNDLVSYKRKHNAANGEGNRDGADENYSANCGVEGETDDPGVEALRKRQIKNFLLTLFISRGVPMLLGGDEFRRTQRGNNNAYCQDNAVSWYDWRFLQRHAEIHRFARGMISFRRGHPLLNQEAFYTDADIRWFSAEGTEPDWLSPDARRLACLIVGQDEPSLYLMFNAGAAAVDFGLPPLLPGTRWHVAVDTSHEAPQDPFAAGEEPLWEDPRTYHLSPRSSAILLAFGTQGQTALTEAK